jgi:hypothetical protein
MSPSYASIMFGPFTCIIQNEYRYDICNDTPRAYCTCLGYSPNIAVWCGVTIRVTWMLIEMSYGGKAGDAAVLGG